MVVPGGGRFLMSEVPLYWSFWSFIEDITTRAHDWRTSGRLITDYVIYERGFAVLPNPCYYQDYDRCMSPLSLVPRNVPRRFARMK